MQHGRGRIPVIVVCSQFCLPSPTKQKFREGTEAVRARRTSSILVVVACSRSCYLYPTKLSSEKTSSNQRLRNLQVTSVKGDLGLGDIVASV